MQTTYEKAEECFNTNYYATKTITQTLLPLLNLSTRGARIVNVSSLRGELWVCVYMHLGSGTTLLKTMNNDAVMNSCYAENSQ